MKKFIIAAAIALCSTFNADAQYGRGDYRSDVIEYVESDFPYQYTLYNNRDIYCKNENDVVVWKFDSNNRIYDVYMWFAKPGDDTEFRNTMNSSNMYSHPDVNTWKQYSATGTIIAIVTYGSFNTTFGDYRTPFIRSSGWHVDYRY